MTDDLNVLLDNPLLLFLVLLVGGLIGMSLEQVLSSIKRQKAKAYWQSRNSDKFRKHSNICKTDAGSAVAEQLVTVMRAQFTSRTLLNKSEAKVFKALDAAVLNRNPRWQVMAQVSMGEFLSSEDEEAFRAINSKRVDFALMDDNCQVRHALENQGRGHHLSEGNAAARDAVKKEALRKASIGYHEIVAGHTTPTELRRLIERLVPAA